MSKHFICSVLLILSWSSYANEQINDQAISQTSNFPDPLVSDHTTLDNLVILQYHHVSTQTPASTSIAPDKFAEHLAHLYRHFNVVDLSDAINALRAGNRLPNKSIAITFDDGYNNILHNAHPLLQKYEFPYTVFINPQRINKDRNQLTWAEVQQMAQEQVTFANHTLDHLHLLNHEHSYGVKESEASWLSRVVRNITQAEALIEAQLGYSLKYVAYPYGEYNTVLAQQLTEQGYVGFGQHSGAVSSQSDFSALPRFPAAGRYANINTLKVKLNSLAMPVLANNVSSPVVTDGGFPSSMTLTLDTTDLQMHAINCFFQGSVQNQEINGSTINVSFPDMFPIGRSRMNCTAPSKTYKGRFHWFSQPFFTPNANSVFPD